MIPRLVPMDLLFAPPAGAGGAADSGQSTSLVPLVNLTRPGGRRRLWWWRPGRERPVVRELNRDRLVLSGGTERACAAKAAGKAWLKVLMPAEVCARWDARPVERLRELMRTTGRWAFYCPVLHPEFRRARVGRPEPTRLDRIRRLLAGAPEGLRGLDIGCNMGYMCHQLQRQGFRMTGIDYDQFHLSVAEALNETYGLDAKFQLAYFGQFQPDQPYDVVLLLTVLYHMLFRQEEQHIPEAARMTPSEVAAKLDALTRHALIWESGPQPQQEIDFLRTRTGLTTYLSLGATRGTGKRRELGVFLRPSSPLARQFAEQHRAAFRHRRA